MKNKEIPEVHDSTGKVIKNHDVLIDKESGQIMIAEEASNKSGVHGLGFFNNVIKASDWADVFPDGMWTIVGNLETLPLEE